MTLPMAQLGWLAGVLDLKAKIVTKANQQRATAQYVLVVDSKDYSLIRELGTMVGTRPELKAKRERPEWMRRGCVEHCPEQHVHVPYQHAYPAMGRWTVTGAAAAVVIYNASIYMRTSKREQLDVVCETLIKQAVLDGQGAGATVKSIRRMADLGWDLPEQFEIALEGYEPPRSA